MEELQASEAVQSFTQCRESSNGKRTRGDLYLIKMCICMLPNQNMSIKDAQQNLDIPTAVVTGCKALYDLIQRKGVQSSLDGHLRWVSSERQLADGLTKIGTRQQMADALKSGWLQLVDDTSYTVSKKKTPKEREE